MSGAGPLRDPSPLSSFFGAETHGAVVFFVGFMIAVVFSVDLIFAVVLVVDLIMSSSLSIL